MSRNALFAIGGVLLAGVLYLGFSGSDDPPAEADAAAKHKKGKKKSGKKAGKKRSAAAASALGVGKICVKLDCSPEQLKTFKGLVKEHRAHTSSNRRALREAHALIAAEYSEDMLNEAALDEAFDAIEEQRGAVDADARSVLATLHGQLSPEQREALAKLVALHGPSELLSRPTDAAPQRASAHGKKGKRKGKRGGKGRRKKKGTRGAPQAADVALDPTAPRAAPAPMDSRRAPPAAGMVDPIKPTRTPIAPEAPPAEPDAADSDGA